MRSRAYPRTTLRSSSDFALERAPRRSSDFALLLALDIGVGAAIDAIDGDSPGQFTGSLSSQLLYPDAEAGRQEPWRHDLGWEITRLWDAKRYHPYLGWTLPDY